MSNIIHTKEFATDSAEYVKKLIKGSLDSNGICVLCLAGGKTPIHAYEKLAGMDIDWNKVYLTMGDDRNVPMDSNESNYKGLNDSLISKIPIPADHVLRIRTELGMKKAAEVYENELKALQSKLDRDYLFDIMLLGLGENGHTASLFPNSEALEITDRLVTPNIVDNVINERITLTYPAIDSSKQIIFLIHDASKKEVMEKIRAGEDFPATKVDQMGDKVTWIVGETA